MRTRIILCAAAVAAFTALGAIFVPKPEAAAAPTVIGETKRAEGRYILGICDGYVAVFAPDGGRYVTETPVSALRANDVLLLEKGIEAESLDAAAALLEDFSG